MDSQRLTLLSRIKDSDIYFSFIKSPTAIVSSIILVIIFFCSFFVEFVAPFNPEIVKKPVDQNPKSTTSPLPKDGRIPKITANK